MMNGQACQGNVLCQVEYQTYNVRTLEAESECRVDFSSFHFFLLFQMLTIPLIMSTFSLNSTLNY